MRQYLLLALAWCAIAFPLQAREPFRFPEGKHGTGELKYVNRVPVLTVSGTPEEIGEAVGNLVVKPAERALDYPRQLMNTFAAGLLWNVVVNQGRDMVKQFPADHRAEMEAMIRASGAPRDKVVAGNTLFDIKKIILCSALMVEADRSSTGGTLLGRNLDYPSLGYIHEYSLVTVYKPKGKRAFVSLGFPGLVGSLSGMNDAGLTVAVLEVLASRKGEGRFEAQGIPYALCFRTLLEECSTIEEAKQRLEKMPRTTMYNMVVADRNRVGTLEVTPKSVVFRPAEQGICTCTNHFCTELKPDAKIDVARSYDRYDFLDALRKGQERISVGDVHRRLHGVNLGDQTLQTMIFEPSTLKVHVGFGEGPSSRLPLRTLDLTTVFKK